MKPIKNQFQKETKKNIEFKWNMVYFKTLTDETNQGSISKGNQEKYRN